MGRAPGRSQAGPRPLGGPSDVLVGRGANVNTLHVVSRDNPLLVRLRKLARDPAAHRRQGEVWIEGDHLCSACVARGQPIVQAVITESAWQQPLLRALAQAAPRIVIVKDSLFAQFSGLESPASIGFVLPWRAQNELRPDAASVVLDRLQDSGNVGSVLRSAAAFGFAQVIALKGTAALWSPKVLRAGMGAHFGLHLVDAVDESALDRLAVPLIATSSHAADALHRAELPWPCAWVLGHEGQGASPQVMRRCLRTVRIAQPGGEESLNAAAAAAVCLYESARRRDPA